MDYAEEEGTGAYADTIEECACPIGYTGTSCENCDEGFYRARTFPYLGVCVPCQCYGHAESCDLNTGICMVSLFFISYDLSFPTFNKSVAARLKSSRQK